MKKSFLLSGMIVLGVVVSVNASQRLTEEQRRAMENVQFNKWEHQQRLARPSIYTMIDALITEEYSVDGTEEVFTVNWPAVFNLIDSMRGTISVNEYRTKFSKTLLCIAVLERNLSAAKILLEKHHANPNNASFFMFAKDTVPLELGNKLLSPLQLAKKLDDRAMINLLIQYGAREEAR